MAGASAPRILLGKVDSGGKANVGTTLYDTELARCDSF